MLGISIFIVYEGDKLMKMKKSKLREMLTEFGLSEGVLSKLISKIQAKNKLKGVTNKIKKLDKDIFSLLKDVPVASEEERAELMKSLGLD